MFPLSRWAVAVGVVLLSSVGVASAGIKSKTTGRCPEWRPCGSGDTWTGNKRIPQGAFGADARPACQKHDDCYDTPGTRRKDCDRAFLHDLLSACESSYRPRACRRRAYLSYLSVRLLGGPAKRKSERAIAAGGGVGG